LDKLQWRLCPIKRTNNRLLAWQEQGVRHLQAFLRVQYARNAELEARKARASVPRVANPSDDYRRYGSLFFRKIAGIV